MKRLTLLPLLLLLLSACQTLPQPSSRPETVWSGKVFVKESLHFPRGTRLTILPGTEIVFASTDKDGDGLGDVSLLLEEGELDARGTLDRPILFTSEGGGTPGLWGEVRLDFSKVSLSYAIVEGSTRGLHLHFSSGTVADSIFRRNLDGTRIGQSKINFERCLFSQNTGKGFNARASTNSVTNSWFRQNRRGVFLFEADEASVFSGNRFTGNETPVRLGDFFEGAVSMTESQLEPGSTGPAPLGSEGYLSEEGQKAKLDWTSAPVSAAGPMGWPLLKPVTEVKMEGFVDAGPFADESGVYAADWGGNVLRLGLFDGTRLASYKAGEPVDSGFARSRAGGAELLAFQTWGRKIVLADALTLKELDSFTEAQSPADDHRQAAPLFMSGNLYAGTWAGKVRAFSVSGALLSHLWEVDVGGPIRADLETDGEKIYALSESGAAFALAPSGKVEWKKDMGAPLLSPPAFEGGALFFGTRAGGFIALDAGTGEEKWRENLCGPAWHAGAGTGGGALYQGDDGGCVSAFDPKSGKLLWRRKLDGGVRATPLYSDATLIVPTLGGSLYLLDARTGFTVDQLSYGEPLQSSPAEAGRIFLGGRDATLRILEIVRNTRPSK